MRVRDLVVSFTVAAYAYLRWRFARFPVQLQGTYLEQLRGSQDSKQHRLELRWMVGISLQEQLSWFLVGFL